MYKCYKQRGSILSCVYVRTYIPTYIQYPQLAVRKTVGESIVEKFIRVQHVCVYVCVCVHTYLYTYTYTLDQLTVRIDYCKLYASVEVANHAYIHAYIQTYTYTVDQLTVRIDYCKLYAPVEITKGNMTVKYNQPGVNW